MGHEFSQADQALMNTPTMHLLLNS